MYRVLELPSSMHSLVYDFGQLDYDTEKDYARGIVVKYVCITTEELHLFHVNVCMYVYKL